METLLIVVLAIACMVVVLLLLAVRGDATQALAEQLGRGQISRAEYEELRRMIDS